MSLVSLGETVPSELLGGKSCSDLQDCDYTDTSELYSSECIAGLCHGSECRDDSECSKDRWGGLYRDGWQCVYGHCQCPKGSVVDVSSVPARCISPNDGDTVLFGLSGPAILGIGAAVALIVYLERIR